MIHVVARFEMLSGKEIETLEALRKAATAVEAEEPDCVVFDIGRSQTNPLEIYVYQVYKNEAAHQLHGKTPHMRELQLVLDETLNRQVFNLDSLNHIAGFIRGLGHG